MENVNDRLRRLCEERLKTQKIKGKKADIARLHFFAGAAFALDVLAAETRSAAIVSFNEVSMKLAPAVKAHKKA